MGNRAYAIAASVPPGNRVREFHGTGWDSAGALLTNIPRFRSGSFDIAVPGDVQPGPEDSMEVAWPGRKHLRLYQDGTLVFRGAADEEFLGWGQEAESFARFPRINPVAAVEVHASFAHFYPHVLERLKSTPAEVAVKISLAGGSTGPERLFITKYYDNIQRVHLPRRYVVHSDPATESLRIPTDVWVRNPNRAGYLIFWSFASLFDLPEEEIPFTKDGADGREIDLDAIKRL